MFIITTKTLELLSSAPPVVVAPVGIGFGQESLEEWARKTKRRILRDPAEFTGRAPALILPQRRSDLERLEVADLEDFLFLQESDLLFSLEDWLEASGPSRAGLSQETYFETGGWPEGLALARRINPKPGEPLLRHPLCTARLGSLVPKDIPRETLAKLAQSPLLVREVYELLELDESLVGDLYDRGLLYSKGSGFTLPRLIRLYLRGRVPAKTVDALEATLRAYGHSGAALELLEEHGLWERYLWLLVETFSVSDGDAYLRNRLSMVPPKFRELPTYRYLGTFLARYAGDLGSMTQELETLIPLAEEFLKPYLLNAYGVSLGMKAEYREALKVFQECLAAIKNADIKLHGDILHNSGVAGVLNNQFNQAHRFFSRSIAVYRALGFFDDEAGTSVALGYLELCLGQPRQAKTVFDRVISFIKFRATQDHLAFVNLAKSNIILGDTTAAEVAVTPVLEQVMDTRLSISTKLCLGNVYLWRNEYRQALALAEEAMQTGHEDQQLADEAFLLMSRIAHRQGKVELAQHHLAKIVGDFRVITESAWQGLRDLDEAIEHMRHLEAKFDLAQLLLRKGDPDSLRAALELSRTYQYGLLLHNPYFAPLWRPLILADESARSAFPLRLQTFGSFKAEFLGASLDLQGFKTRKAAILLVFLALNPRPHNRESLADLFWGDGSNPLASLNTAISELRRIFDAPVIEGNKGQIWLGFPIKTDLEEFLSASEPYSRQAASNQADRIEALLTQFDAAWLPEFPDWFAEERLNVENRQAHLWRMLADHYAERSPHRAIGAYRHVVKLEPYDPEAWQRLIELYDSMGEPSLSQQAQQAMRKALVELASSETA